MKIYDGEPEMPIDAWSMVVNLTDQSPRMKIPGGESEMPIDENLWWWYNWNKGGCPKQTEGRGGLNKMTVGGCPKQDDK